MARIVELMTVNIAVEHAAESAPLYETMGLGALRAKLLADPPAQVVDLTFPLRGGAAFSLIEPTGADTPVGRFLARRGPGLFSLTVRVDDLVGAMHDWGFDWLYDEPLVWHDAKAITHRVETLLMNWVLPRSLGGVLLEAFEFRGHVEPWAEADA